MRIVFSDDNIIITTREKISFRIDQKQIIIIMTDDTSDFFHFIANIVDFFSKHNAEHHVVTMKIRPGNTTNWNNIYNIFTGVMFFFLTII